MRIPKRVYNKENLYRAWMWIKSNPQRQFKNYFREIYSAFSITEEQNIKTLHSHLKDGVYEPTKACKIYFPKSSGILRPYTLLTVEDQIVYQAISNIIAEKLHKKIKGNYYKKTFSHMYAGKESKWFYRKWDIGYRRMNGAAKKAYDEGYIYTASFDLTAFYDSIDHQVLMHFLRKLNLPNEFNESFETLLNTWTATRENILHGHGIPQGPLSSGMISEVVLHHFDESITKEKSKKVKYFRYVDDILLFAKEEEDLRFAIVDLDKTSKDIGLFPQSDKVQIRRIENINDVLKTISEPDTDLLNVDQDNQEQVYKNIVKITPSYKVKSSHSREFGFLVEKAEPSYKLTDRLLRIAKKMPSQYERLSRYLARYERNISFSIAKKILDIIYNPQPYDAIPSYLLSSIRGKISKKNLRYSKSKFKHIWNNKGSQEDLTGYLARFLISENQLTEAQISIALSKKSYWWAKTQIYLALSPKTLSQIRLNELIKKGIKSNNDDVAICAARLIGLHGLETELENQNEVNDYAKNLLKEFGVIKRRRGRACGIKACLKKFITNPPNINWKKYFRNEYSNVEKHIIEMKGYETTNASAWVMALDVFNDYLLYGLYQSDPSLGAYQLEKNKIGGITTTQPNKLKQKYPLFLKYITDVHNQRYMNRLSHTRIRSTGKPTKGINYKYIGKSKNLLKAALNEIKIKLNL